MIAILLFALEFWLAEPTYHWITVTQAGENWTDGVDTWVGLPGCKSAGMPAGECGLLPVAPSELKLE